MSTGSFKRAAFALAAAITLTTLITPQPASAGLFDWLNPDNDPPPPPPPGWNQPSRPQPAPAPKPKPPAPPAPKPQTPPKPQASPAAPAPAAKPPVPPKPATPPVPPKPTAPAPAPKPQTPPVAPAPRPAPQPPVPPKPQTPPVAPAPRPAPQPPVPPKPQLPPVAPAPRPQPQPQPQPQRPPQARPQPTPQSPWWPFDPDPVPPGPQDEDTRDGSDKDLAYNEFRLQPAVNMPFLVTKTEWTDADEARYSMFVNRLGLAISQKMCNTVKSCMRSPSANIYAQQDPPNLILYSDCADFPYFLRTYFAYHNGLPMGYVTSVAISQAPVASAPTRDGDLATARLDNSPYGNIIQARGGSNEAKAPGGEWNFIHYLTHMFDAVSTRTFRVGPLYPNYDLSDVYPVPIHRGGVRAGTVVLSTGHALVVWNINQKGIVQVIDAHPDGSVQFKEVKSSTLDRSRPDHGLGFFRFRPLRLVGAQAAANGAYYGGKIVGETDAELYKEGKYSLEQYFGPEANIAPGTKVDPALWTSAFKTQNFFDFLADRMRMADVVVKADEEISDVMAGLCNELTLRVTDVDAAVNAGIPSQTHPDTLPQDIFSASGPWEDYSTPGRDGRVKASVEDVLKQAVSKFRQAKGGDPNMKFDGTAQDYQTSLRSRLAAMDKKCIIRYKNSAGNQVSLTFTQVLLRLNKMSFDPYHCPERRWGASGSELATCRDSDQGGAWYDGEKYMRNTAGKLNASEIEIVRSDRPITLDMLRNTSLIDQPDGSQVNLGTATPPIMDLDKNFASDHFIQLLN